MPPLPKRFLLSFCLLLTAAGTAVGIEGGQPGMFAFGGVGFAGATSPGELKFREIFATDDPADGFAEWAEKGGSVGKAYAMVAFYYLDADRYAAMKKDFAAGHLQVPTMSGCLVGSMNHEQLFESIEDGKYDSVVKPLLPEAARAKHFPEDIIDVFAFGGIGIGGQTSNGELQFREIYTSDAPLAGFDRWAANGTPAQRAYALVGFYTLDPVRYQMLKDSVQNTTDTFATMRGCIVMPLTYAALISQIEKGRYDSYVQSPLSASRAPQVHSSATAAQGDRESLFGPSGEDVSSGTNAPTDTGEATAPAPSTRNSH